MAILAPSGPLMEEGRVGSYPSCPQKNKPGTAQIVFKDHIGKTRRPCGHRSDDRQEERIFIKSSKALRR